jgi:hypothetical protein
MRSVRETGTRTSSPPPIAMLSAGRSDMFQQLPRHLQTQHISTARAILTSHHGLDFLTVVAPDATQTDSTVTQIVC